MSNSGETSDRAKTRSVSDDAALWRRFRGALGEDFKATPAHRLKLSGKSPDGFGLHLSSLIPPDEDRGAELISGTWQFGQDHLSLEDGSGPWNVPAPSRHFADRIHRFEWLNDLIAQGEPGGDRARLLLDDWIEQFSKFNGFAWRVGPTADRLWNWLSCGPILFEIGSEEQIQNRVDALMRQVRHLEATLDASPSPAARWRGSCVLVVVSLALRAGKKLEDHWHRLEAECTAQILADGGHVMRSPERLLLACADLLAIKDLYERAGRPEPEYLSKWLPRMAAMLNFFVDGDGALDPFNNGGESRPEIVKAIMDKFGNGKQRSFSFAMKSGFQKLEKNGLRLILDCGEAPEFPFGDQAHAGVLGFQFSDNKARIVTSCGFSPNVNLDWQAAVRRTGAHSTLVIAGRDSAPFVVNDQTRLLAPTGPEGISAKRKEEDQDSWIDAQHSGYKSNYGMFHRRNLFMSADRDRLVGEDALVRPVSEGNAESSRPINFDIRFHLHPTITAITTGDSIRLISDFGPVWRFKTTQPGTRLEPSIYLGRGRVERTEQIVLSGRADPSGDGAGPPNCVKWAFLKDGGS